MEAEKSELEESLIRYANLQIDNAEKQMKEIAIKLFAVSTSVAGTFELKQNVLCFVARLSIRKRNSGQGIDRDDSVAKSASPCNQICE